MLFRGVLARSLLLERQYGVVAMRTMDTESEQTWLPILVIANEGPWVSHSSPL